MANICEARADNGELRLSFSLAEIWLHRKTKQQQYHPAIAGRKKNAYGIRLDASWQVYVCARILHMNNANCTFIGIVFLRWKCRASSMVYYGSTRIRFICRFSVADSCYSIFAHMGCIDKVPEARCECVNTRQLEQVARSVGYTADCESDLRRVRVMHL